MFARGLSARCAREESPLPAVPSLNMRRGNGWGAPLLDAMQKASGSGGEGGGTSNGANCTIRPGASSACSSTSSIGLDADVVPVRMASPGQGSPRLSYLRMLSGRMVNAGLEPLEPPASFRERLPTLPLAPMSGVLADPSAGQKAGSVGIIFTLWNTMMGSTLLVMPYTFQQAGWLLALALSLFCAIFSHFTCALILKYSEGLMADPSAEFADLAHLHFGAVGRLLAFLTGNVVVLGAAVAMHGYTATVLSHLIAFSPEHGGFCSASASDFVQRVAGLGGAPQPPRPAPGVSPCLAPLNDVWPPVHEHAPNPILVIAVLIVMFPLANLPSIRLLARLNTVGVLCFMIILGFAYTSAIVAGVDPDAFRQEQMVRPASAGIVFGIFSLSFFIHNAVMTIMRGAAKPSNNPRDVIFAFGLVWLCYVSMGLSANLCPPLHNIDALGSSQAKNGMLSLEQPPEMAPFLVIGRLAVLVQSMSVYPVLLFIVRSQLFAAFVYRRPYPGPLPTFVLAVVQATITTSFTALGVDIADVLKFAGAGGGLVCCFGLPALIHAKVSWQQGTLTCCRTAIVAFLCAYGVFCVVMQLIPSSGHPSAGNSTTNRTNGTLAH